MKVVFDRDTHVRNCTQFLLIWLELTSELTALTASLVLHLFTEKYDANNVNKYRMYGISVLEVLKIHVVIFRVVTYRRLLEEWKGSRRISPIATTLRPFTSWIQK